MSKHFDVTGGTLQEIAQSFLEMKKLGRSLENSSDALHPLTDDSDIRQKLEVIAECGRKAAQLSSELYRLIARDAMKGAS